MVRQCNIAWLHTSAGAVKESEAFSTLELVCVCVCVIQIQWPRNIAGLLSLLPKTYSGGLAN